MLLSVSGEVVYCPRDEGEALGSGTLCPCGFSHSTEQPGEMAGSSQFTGEKTEAPGGVMTCSRSPCSRPGGSETASGMEVGQENVSCLRP